MKFVFLVDPLAGLKISKDTSYVLMLAAVERGHEAWVVFANSFVLRAGKLVLKAERVTPTDNKSEPFLFHEKRELKADEINAFLIRTDPPFDAKYLTHTWFLDYLPEEIPVINSTLGLRSVNEKIWAAQFNDVTPITEITCDLTDFQKFLQEHKKIAVKPANGFGGASVFLTEVEDKNANVIFETLSAQGKEYVILQKYLPAATEGDKRILLLDGEPLGAILRMHSETDHRNNFAAGGKALPAEITPRELEIIEKLKPYLNKLDLFFVGIDIIGETLIEVNVTSPTCLREMISAYGKRLDLQVIEAIEHRTQAKNNAHS
ncbi:MAG: glutathione synthase [Leptospiraceae bacterium]|nr:glutathione synthase [Leptospiraceae bacterium]